MAFQQLCTATPLKATLFQLHQHAELIKNRGLQPRRLTLLQKKSRKSLGVIGTLSKADDDSSKMRMSGLSSLSPSDSIKAFYSSINNKNLEQLGRLIADDCFFEDYSFPKPFVGKQDTMRFFKRLTKSMGENMEFNVEDTFQRGDDLTIGVIWHLDWKGKQIPFTRGCSYFDLEEVGEILVIMKARVVIESPIKPGELVLVLCGTVTSLFDAWPRVAACFLSIPVAIFHQLSSPQAMFQLLTSCRTILHQLLKCRR